MKSYKIVLNAEQLALRAQLVAIEDILGHKLTRLSFKKRITKKDRKLIGKWNRLVSELAESVAKTNPARRYISKDVLRNYDRVVC